MSWVSGICVCRVYLCKSCDSHSLLISVQLIHIHHSLHAVYDTAWAVFHGNDFTGEMPLSVCENSDKASPPGKITLLSADCLEDGPVVCSCCDYCGEAL